MDVNALGIFDKIKKDIQPVTAENQQLIKQKPDDSLFSKVSGNIQKTGERVIPPADLYRDMAASKGSLFTKAYYKRTSDTEPLKDRDFANFLLSSSEYSHLINTENLDPRTLDLFEKLLLTAAGRGYFIKYNSFDNNFDFNLDFSETKFSLYRHNEESIGKLISYIELIHNPDALRRIEGRLYETFPKLEDFNINSGAEKCGKLVDYAAFDIESNIRQHTYEEIDFNGDLITGGGLGSYYAQGKRYVEFLQSYSKKPTIKCYQANNGIAIRITGCNIGEGFLISIIEPVIAQFLLSARADGQVDLVSLFREFMQNLPVPVDSEIIRSYLYHERALVPMLLNAKFDINQMQEVIKQLETADELTSDKYSKFDFILKQATPKVISFMYGNVLEHQNTVFKEFKLKFGNLTAGINWKFAHSMKYHKDGVPDIRLSSIQLDSQNICYPVDVKILAKSLLFKRADLHTLSKGTKYPKLSEESMRTEDKVFVQERFGIAMGKFKKHSYYLFRDCLATLSAYGKVTHNLNFDKLAAALKIDFTNLDTSLEPLTSKLISTAKISKIVNFAYLMNKTQQDMFQIQRNIKSERYFFDSFDKIKHYLNINDISFIYEQPIYFAGRIESFGYGWIRPTKYKRIIPSDFKGQYPLMARQCAAIKQLELASLGLLHTKLSSNIPYIKDRMKQALVKILSQTRIGGKIPDKTLIHFLGVAHVTLKDPFLIRQDKDDTIYKLGDKRPKTKKVDKLIDGIRYIFLTEIAHAILRKGHLDKRFHNLPPDVAIDRIFEQITFHEAVTLDFNSNDVSDYGDEFYTQLINLRDEYKDSSEKVVEQMLKITANASYGITAEGISKDDYLGKLFIQSIACCITALARFCNNLAETLVRYYDGIPLYTHTDSLIFLIDEKHVSTILRTFDLIDLLEDDTTKASAKKSAIWNVDYFLCLGKSKYCYHAFQQKKENGAIYCEKLDDFTLPEQTCPKFELDKEKKIIIDGCQECSHCKHYWEEKWTYTDAGSGTWSFAAAPSYKKMAECLYNGMSFEEAIIEATKIFPTHYQLTLNKYSAGTIRTLQKILKNNKPVETLNYKLHQIYIFEYFDKKTKQLKKLITTTNNIYRGMFADYTNISPNYITKAQRKHYDSEFLDIHDKAGRNIIFANYSVISQQELVYHVLNYSTSLNKYEKNEINRYFITKYKGSEHLKSRFSFKQSYYHREVDPDYLKKIAPELAKVKVNKPVEPVKPNNPSKTQINKYKKELARYNKKLAKYPANLKKALKKRVTACIMKDVWETREQAWIPMIPLSETAGKQFSSQDFIDKHEIKDIKVKDLEEHYFAVNKQPLLSINDTVYFSDGFQFNGTFKAPDMNITEYQIGNLNKHPSQALVNASRTLSCEYIKTHKFKNKKQLYNETIFIRKVRDLPIPKLGGLRSEGLDYGTVRAKMKFFPVLHPTKGIRYEKWLFQLAFRDHSSGEGIEEKTEGDKPFIYITTDEKEKELQKLEKEQLKKEWMQVFFFDLYWSIELINYKEYQDANATFLIGIGLGKYKDVHFSLRINFATAKFMNFHLFPVSRNQLQTESKIAAIIMNKVLDINLISVFGRNSSQTLADLQLKKKPTFLLDAANTMFAAILLKDAARYSSVTLSKFHIADDITVKNEKVAQWSLDLANSFSAMIYEDMANNCKITETEIKLRKVFDTGRAKTGSSATILNIPRQIFNVAYLKSAPQILKKCKRAFMHSETPVPLFKQIKKDMQNKKPIIRIETQLNKFDSIFNDASYELHQMWKEIILIIIREVMRYFNSLKEPIDKIFNVVKGKITAFMQKQIEPLFGSVERISNSTFWNPSRSSG